MHYKLDPTPPRFFVAPPSRHYECQLIGSFADAVGGKGQEKGGRRKNDASNQSSRGGERERKEERGNPEKRKKRKRGKSAGGRGGADPPPKGVYSSRFFLNPNDFQVRDPASGRKIPACSGIIINSFHFCAHPSGELPVGAEIVYGPGFACHHSCTCERHDKDIIDGFSRAAQTISSRASGTDDCRITESNWSLSFIKFDGRGACWGLGM